MAVTLFRRRKVINNITIINKIPQKEPIEPTSNIPQEVTAKVRGKMYGRRTINR